MTLRIRFVEAEKTKPVNMVAWHLGIRGGGEQMGTGLESAQDAALAEGIKSHYVLCDDEHHDCLMFAQNWVDEKAVRGIEERFRDDKRPIIALMDHDDLRPLASDKVTIFRTSAYRSSLQTNERVLPALHSDPASELSCIGLKAGCPAPIGVSFCGYTANPLIRLTLRLMGKVEKERGLSLRDRIIRRLAKNSKLRTSFIVRNKFRGGLLGDINSARNQTPRKEYLTNLMAGAFSLCIRGAGNFSYRFYEALACGRIPLLISSDDALPFESEIEWDKHVLRLSQTDVDQADIHIAAFVERLGLGGLEACMNGNRLLWEQYLSPYGFICHQLPKFILSKCRAGGDDVQQFQDT